MTQLPLHRNRIQMWLLLLWRLRILLQLPRLTHSHPAFVAVACVPFIAPSAIEQRKRSAYTNQTHALHTRKGQNVMPVVNLGVGRLILIASFTSDPAFL